MPNKSTDLHESKYNKMVLRVKAKDGMRGGKWEEIVCQPVDQLLVCLNVTADA